MKSNVDKVGEVCDGRPLWSLCKDSIFSKAFGRIDGYHFFANERTAVCGQAYEGHPFHSADECTRPGLPLHCSQCEDLAGHSPVCDYDHTMKGRPC